ncbi:MAG: hypothetical protein KDC24_07815 [Saprospiraceae bacterium]|nr:hypothetical protein [Saprospiraceae bacterium]
MLQKFKRSILYSLLVIGTIGFVSTTQSSCKVKEGCPINEEAHVKPDRKGNLPMGGGRSQLFPKDMRKKMKKD